MPTVGCRKLGAVGTKGRRPRTECDTLSFCKRQNCCVFPGGKQFKDGLDSRHAMMFDCSQNFKVYESCYFFKFENSHGSKMAE